MKIPKPAFGAAVLLIGLTTKAQQTGTVMSTTPGSAGRLNITARRVVLKPTCDTAPVAAGGEVNSVPEMLFGRSFDELVCVRHADGRTEQLRTDQPNGVASADGSAIAYWNPEKHEFHIFLAASRTDTLVESLPGANMRDIAWSRTGHTVSYLPFSANPAGIRSYDIDSGRRNLIDGSFVGLVASPDAAHVFAVGADGIESLAIADGKREIVAKLKHPWSAEYSRSAKLLGILGNADFAEQKSPQTGTQAPTGEDDDVDCRGGSSALIIQNTSTKQFADVPNPRGFDTVLDFSFSPDETEVAVTFGVVGCDYPGDRARIYLVSLADMKLTAISPEDNLSVKPVWTPDGKAIVYSDYMSNSLVAFELATRKATRLTNPGQFGPDEWLGWGH